MARKLWQLRVDSEASIECSAEGASIKRASTNPARAHRRLCLRKLGIFLSQTATLLFLLNIG